MFYKIISGGQIVDVCDGLTFVRWNQKTNLFLTTKNEGDATGILSSDGSNIYLLEGQPQVGELEYASYAEIDETTYTTLREELVKNGVLDVPQEPEDKPTEGDNQEQEPVKKSEALKRIEELQGQVDFLTECLLEMSEHVYV